SAWSAAKNFSVVPTALTVLGPTGTVNNLQPTVTWSATPGAATYQLWVDGAGVSGLVNVSSLTATSFTFSQALTPGTYTAWVGAFSSAGGASAWSAAKSFTVAAPAPAVNLGSQVVWFALSKLGTQVGGGECTDLVNAALQAAGAK